MKYNLKSIKRINDRDLRDEAFLRYFLKRKYNLHPLHERGGLMDEPHYLKDCCNDDYWTEYWLESGWENADDEELFEYRKDLIKRNPYPWDCSGLPITLFLRVKRLKSGLVLFVHYQTIDV